MSSNPTDSPIEPRETIVGTPSIIGPVASATTPDISMDTTSVVIKTDITQENIRDLLARAKTYMTSLFNQAGEVEEQIDNERPEKAEEAEEGEAEEEEAEEEEAVEEEEEAVEEEEEAEECEVEEEAEECEVEEEAEEEEAEVEEADEVESVMINNKEYYTTNSTNGVIYNVDENGDITDEVGVFKNGVATFYSS